MKRKGSSVGSPQATVKKMKASADALARHITSKTTKWKKGVKV